MTAQWTKPLGGYLDEVLARRQYISISDDAYLLVQDGSDIDHMLFKQIWGARAENLTIWLGMRHLSAEIFSARIFQEFFFDGNESYAQIGKNLGLCSYKCEFGRFHDWGPRRALLMDSVNFRSSLKAIDSGLGDQRLDEVRNIRAVSQMLSFLIADIEPFPWNRTNKQIRLAQIGFLAKAMNFSKEDIGNLLRGVASKRSFATPVNFDLNEYVKRVETALSDLP